MIRVSWNDLPQSVRKNAADYWSDYVTLKMKNSIVDALVEEFNGNISPIDPNGIDYARFLRTMEFTDEQYTMLLLKYS